jgi:hypothetical protein
VSDPVPHRTAVGGLVGHAGGNTQQPGNGQNRGPTTRQRVVVLIAVLCGLFLTLVYESGLVLQLFLDQPSSQFRSIEDVKNCHIGANQICMARGEATEAFWRAAVEPARATCRVGELANDQPVLVGGDDPFRSGLEKAASGGSCEFFMAATSTVTVAAETVYCGKLRVVGQPFYRISTGFTLPKGSNLTEALSKETLKLLQQDKLPSAVAYGTANIKCPHGSDTQLTWARLKVFFYVVYPTLGIMFLIMLLDPNNDGAAGADDDGDRQGGGGDVENGAAPGAAAEPAADR